MPATTTISLTRVFPGDTGSLTSRSFRYSSSSLMSTVV